MGKGGMAMVKTYEELELKDDFMFSVIMRDPRYVKPFLETILRIKIAKIEYPEVQKNIDIAAGAKGIRLDVYVEDEKHTVFNLEMQTTTARNLPKRMRYYQGMIDLNILEKGDDYNHLKKSYVIFICTFDPFKDNRSIYTFQTICKENKGIVLEDKRLTYFVNIYGSRDGISRKTVDLLDYFKTGKPTDIYTKNIQDQVEIIRDDNEWRENYMTIEMKLDQKYEDGLKHGRIEGEKFGRIEGEKIGRTEGEIEKEKELIAKWLQKGKTIAAIAEDLDKTEIYVKNLMKQL